MTTENITTTPFHLEPLPLYRPTAYDPETSSIISSCPSYVSDAPTYHSRRPSTTLPNTATTATYQPQYRIYTSLLDISAPPPAVNTRNGLPPLASHAPGFTPSPRTPDDLANYNIGSFNSFRTSQHSRQYQNVATRRARAAAAAADAHSYTSLLSLPENRVASASTATTPSSTAAPANAGSTNPVSLTASDTNPSASSTTSAPETTRATSSSALPDTEPHSPHEDPRLVGERAATAARQQRIYREACLSGADSLSWDFMMLQMGGWETRRAGNAGGLGGGGGGVGSLGAVGMVEGEMRGRTRRRRRGVWGRLRGPRR